MLKLQPEVLLTSRNYQKLCFLAVNVKTHSFAMLIDSIQELLQVCNVVRHQHGIVCISYVVNPLAIYLDTYFLIFQCLTEYVFRV